ncbi:hypothetical protein [Gordonia amicalis]|uniref:Uncharacterized protein n=1 Tax=Gordonia amicalis TaxID=89053 RepID=A0ABU4DLE7_9ACTN|nr:hypothetical protein [Gordonia amicalis]MDV6310052.1 hypothetical protein [Gordonia amicalis]
MATPATATSQDRRPRPRILAATAALARTPPSGETAVRGCAVPANGETDRYVARVLALR